MLELKGCYSPADIIMMFSLFVALLATIGSFIVLMVYLIKGAFDTVQDIKQSKQVGINTQ